MYERGLIVEQDPKVAADWIRRAADQGYTPAMCHLAGTIEDTTDERQGREAATGYLQRAAALGDPHAAYRLGMKLINQGGEDGVAVGLTWIKKAAATKHSLALVFLAGVYGAGRLGVPRDKDLSSLLLALGREPLEDAPILERTKSVGENATQRDQDDGTNDPE